MFTNRLPLYSLGITTIRYSVFTGWLLRYVLFHHQTTTIRGSAPLLICCVISSFITKPQPKEDMQDWLKSCVISSFITKPQPGWDANPLANRCVISSFITKPQLSVSYNMPLLCCVISSFITKPQQNIVSSRSVAVALYPLSSPNHNITHEAKFFRLVALYPLSSPNHNHGLRQPQWLALRYILFHHQTTTQRW